MGSDRRRGHGGSRGVDLSLMADDRRRARNERRLCRQVQEALGYALPALRDEVLRDLWVMDVEPAPDMARLCAVVEAPRGASIEDVYTRLDKAAGLLRTEVAEAIARKRTPVITFRVIPANTGANIARTLDSDEDDDTGAGEEDE